MIIKKEILEKMEKSIIEGIKEDAEKLAREAVEKKLDVNEVIEKGFIIGIKKVGELWEKGEYFLPELITSAECMKAAMNILGPELRKENRERKSVGKVVIGTVQGDIHDIGKNLVASMLVANGFEVIDLGADVKLEKFIEKAEEVDAQFICLSALLTTTMLGQKKVVEMARERNIRRKCKILVGGAPVNQKWAENIGADGYAGNAMAAVRLAIELVKK